MNRLKQTFIWLRRMPHSRGFGIQSPSDYQFVRYVVNEHWPYHAYDNVEPEAESWTGRKLGRLYLRMANYLQPAAILDMVGAKPYLQAGCQRAQFVSKPQEAQLTIAPIQIEYQQLLTSHQDGQRTYVVFQDIWKHPNLWHCIEHDERATLTFDLYYCGIVVIDQKRAKQRYTINF